MAQGNDVVDLTGLAADKFLDSAQIIGSDLVLTMNDGEVLTVDLNLAPDIFLDGAVINAQDILLLTMNDGTTHEVDLSAYATVDTYVQSATVDGLSGIVTLTLNDGSTVTFDISSYVTNADVQLSTATYNCNTNSIDLIETDGNVTTVDMSCFVDNLLNSERGGVAYDANKSYIAGDVVTLMGETYISISGSSASPSNNPGDWANIHTPETGGGAWDNSLTYEAGDMVTKGNLIYIAQLPSTNDDPSAGSGSWREYNSVWHVASAGGSVSGALHNPNLPAIDSYPNATVETLGAMWYIDGLGDGVTYTYTAGSLAGITVRDKDRIVWASGLDSAPDFIHLATAVISIERGGVAWSSSIDYVVGDIVTDPNGYGYKNILAVTANATPPAGDTLHWIKAVRTGEYDSTLIYEGGDIISYAGNVYVAPTGGIGPGVEPGTGAWVATDTPERGGIAWLGTTKYEPGDMVSLGSLIYTAININTGNQPDLFPADWLIPSDPANVERGGVKWEAATDYIVGDVVASTGFEIYIALADNNGLIPENNPTEWKIVTRENGGIAHDAITPYKAGDLVSELIGGVRTIFIAKVDNNGILPSSDANTWELVVSATTYQENGGVEWQSTTTYTPGDTVIEFSGSTPIGYVALLANTNVLPSLNLDDEWTLLVPTEVGGRDWNQNLDYLVGDIVAEFGIVYQCIQAHTLANFKNPATSPAYWQIVDKAGSAYDATTNYEAGDLATDGETTYVALTANTGATPATSPADWKVVDKAGTAWDTLVTYEVGDIVSEGGLIYFALATTIGQTPGTVPAVWKQVKDNNEFDPGTPYDAGQMVVVGSDIFIAPPGGVPAGAWDSSLWIAATNEGDLWQGGINYDLGDMTSFEDIVYVALGDNLDIQPDTDALVWRIVGGAGVHNDARPYFEGDIVSVGSDLYIAPVGGVPAGPFNASEWIAATKEGDLWVADVNYVVGAVVSWADNAYVAMNPSIGSQPSVLNANWRLHVAHDDYATSTVGGTLKARVDSGTGTLYLTFDGTDA